MASLTKFERVFTSKMIGAGLVSERDTVLSYVLVKMQRKKYRPSLCITENLVDLYIHEGASNSAHHNVVKRYIKQ